MSFSFIEQKNQQTTELSADAKKYLDEKSQAVLMVLGKRGISGWVFDIPTGESVTGKTSLSKHYVESGAVITDHAVNEPDEITLSGLVGELVYRVPQGVEGTLSDAASRLGAVNAFLGPLTQGATQKAAMVYAQASYVVNQAKAIAKRVSNVVDFFSGDEATLTLQQKAYFEIQALQKTVQLVWVLTPWNLHQNMLISQMTARQDAESSDYTDFSVTLQEARITKVKTTTFDEGTYKAAIDAQNAEMAENGKVAGMGTDEKGIFLTVAKSAGWKIAQ